MSGPLIRYTPGDKVNVGITYIGGGGGNPNLTNDLTIQLDMF